MSSDRLGHYLVILGAAVGGSLGVLALATLIVASGEPGSLSLGLSRAGGPSVQLLLLGVLVGYVILLAQMVRGGTIALGCGGLLGLVMALIGIASLMLVGTGAATIADDGATAISGVAFTFAMAVAGPALALGALLRLSARRTAAPGDSADP